MIPLIITSNGGDTYNISSVVTALPTLPDKVQFQIYDRTGTEVLFIGEVKDPWIIPLSDICNSIFEYNVPNYPFQNSVRTANTVGFYQIQLFANDEPLLANNSIIHFVKAMGTYSGISKATYQFGTLFNTAPFVYTVYKDEQVYCGRYIKTDTIESNTIVSLKVEALDINNTVLYTSTDNMLPTTQEVDPTHNHRINDVIVTKYWAASAINWRLVTGENVVFVRAFIQVTSGENTYRQDLVTFDLRKPLCKKTDTIYCLYGYDVTGAQIVIPCYGSDKTSVKTTRKNYLDGVNITHNYFGTETDTITLNTGWFDEQYNNAIKGLMSCNDVMLLRAIVHNDDDYTSVSWTHPETGYISLQNGVSQSTFSDTSSNLDPYSFPVTITNSYSEKKFVTDKKLVNYQLTCQVNKANITI